MLWPWIRKLRAIAAKKSRRVPSRPARISHTFAPRSACTDLMPPSPNLTSIAVVTPGMAREKPNEPFSRR